MKKLFSLLLLTGVVLCSSCKYTFSVTQTISIATTKESIDVDLQKVKTIVEKMNQPLIREELYKKYPDAIKQYTEKIKINFIKEKNKNITTNTETFRLKIKIVMNYEKSKSEQAIQIIRYYGKCISDELVKNGITLEKK